ncbi:9830_t:CDS:2, partial [Gigaspora rosea]
MGAESRNSNMNSKPKFNSEDYRKIGAVERILDDGSSEDHMIYEFRTSSIDSGEMMVLVERLLIHNYLGDREKGME